MRVLELAPCDHVSLEGRRRRDPIVTTRRQYGRQLLARTDDSRGPRRRSSGATGRFTVVGQLGRTVLRSRTNPIDLDIADHDIRVKPGLVRQ